MHHGIREYASSTGNMPKIQNSIRCRILGFKAVWLLYAITDLAPPYAHGAETAFGITKCRKNLMSYIAAVYSENADARGDSMVA